MDIPTPSFIHFGLEGGPTTVYPFDFRGEPSILVGTFQGQCLIFSLRTNLLTNIVYEDPSKRHIIALGVLKKPDLMTIETYQFWVHFRGDAVEFFILVEAASKGLQKVPKFERIRQISAGHFGYAKAFFDENRQRLIVPDYMDTNNLIKIRYENGGETCFSISTEYLQKNLVKLGSDCENLDISRQHMFKGALMSIEILEDPPNDRLLLALEESILVFDLKTKQVVTCFKHPKFNNILTVTSKFYSDEKQTRTIVSVVGRLFSLTYAESDLKLDKLLKNTKKSGIECNNLAFSPLGAHVSCGFANGTVEIYVVPAYTLCYKLEYQENSIYSLNWVEFEKEHNKTLLCIGSEDGKLLLYNL